MDTYIVPVDRMQNREDFWRYHPEYAQGVLSSVLSLYHSSLIESTGASFLETIYLYDGLLMWGGQDGM